MIVKGKPVSLLTLRYTEMASSRLERYACKCEDKARNGKYYASITEQAIKLLSLRLVVGYNQISEEQIGGCFITPLQGLLPIAIERPCDAT